jgi:hypothetical protein
MIYELGQSQNSIKGGERMEEGGENGERNVTLPNCGLTGCL